MKNRIQYLILVAVIFISQYVLVAQTSFGHIASQNNISANTTTINNPLSNGKANAFILVSQVYGNQRKYNPHHIGVYYYQGKWRIFNQDRHSMKVGTEFSVLIIDPAKLDRTKATAFLHKGTSSNISNHMTAINHPFANNNPNARIYITHNSQSNGPDNNHPVGVWYSAGKWYIYNENRSKMPNNIKFNVLILKPGNFPNALGSGVKITSSKHTANASNIQRDITKTSLTGSPASVFATHDYGSGPYLKSPIGLYYINNKWGIFNQDKAPMPARSKFNVLKVTSSIIFIPHFPIPKSNQTAKYLEAVINAQRNTNQRQSPQGPDFEIETYPVFSNLDADLSERFDHFSTSKFSMLNANLIRDKAAGSGVFYYIPKSYTLRWDSDLGKHQLNINYSRNTGDREARSAQVNATLASGITIKEINFMEEMIRELLKTGGVPNPKVELKPLPVESPTVVFNGAGFSIDSDQISIVAFSDFSEKIEMSFTTSDDDIDALKTGLQNKLPFSLHFKSKVDEEQAYDIPASISIKDEEAYGIFEVDLPALQNAKNPTPFPIMAQYLHVLTTTNSTEGIVPYIYSFELGNKTVQPNDIIKFKKPTGFRIPPELSNGQKPIRVFVEYRLLDCDPCFRVIINELTGGLTAATKQRVTFRPVNLIRSTGAEFIWIKMRSKQLDPQNQRIITTFDPIEISDDSNGVESPTLFLFDSQPPKFEYQVELVMPNGEEYIMDHWIEGSQLAIRLSPHKLKEHFNNWPSNNTDLEEDDSGEEGDNK